MISPQVQLNEVLADAADDSCGKRWLDGFVMRLLQQIEAERIADHRDIFALRDLAQIRLDAANEAQLRGLDAQDSHVSRIGIFTYAIDLRRDGVFTMLTGLDDFDFR